MFQFELVITEKCNLDCKYCYMNNIGNSMTKHVLDWHLDMLPRIMNAYQEKQFITTFFGGEPLLNYPLIKYAISKLADSKKIILPTNGILLNSDIIKFLKDNNVEISLSFDGLWQRNVKFVHFHKIIEELELKSCKAMVSPENIVNHSLAENYHTLYDMGIENPDFTLVRDNIWKESDINRFETQLIELADIIITRIKNGFETLPGIFSLYILDTLVGKKYGKRSYGCFAGNHGAAFMPNGSIYPCARFGSNKKEEIANSVTKDIDWNRMSKLCVLSDIKSMPDCNYCDLYYYCNTGCFYNQYQERKPLSNVCKLFKICYREAYRIVHELKYDKTFKKMLKNIAGELL